MAADALLPILGVLAGGRRPVWHEQGTYVATDLPVELPADGGGAVLADTLLAFVAVAAEDADAEFVIEVLGRPRDYQPHEGYPRWLRIEGGRVECTGSWMQRLDVRGMAELFVRPISIPEGVSVRVSVARCETES